MTPVIALTLTIIVAAVVLFATEKLRVDVIAMLVLLTLALTGLVTVDEAFAGFASPAVVTVWAIYIVSGGLFRTGVTDYLGKQIARVAGNRESRLVTVIMLMCGGMSAFMNNIGAVAMLLPGVAGVSRQTKVPLSKLLIPLSFASLMGGNMTLIGTPPNVLAAGMLAERGLPTFRFFDFFPTGVIIFITGVLYMVFVGRKLLPVRTTVEDLASGAKLREYVSEVRVLPGSTLIGQTLLESRLGADYDLNVLEVIRDGDRREGVGRDMVLQEDDLLLVEGMLERLMALRGELGLAIEAERKLELAQEGSDVQVFEAVVAPRSPIQGHTLRELQFRERFGFTVLALWRQAAVIRERVRDVRLRFGDTLLLQGPQSRLAALQEGDEFLVLNPVDLQRPREKKAVISLLIVGLVLLLVTVGGFHVAVAMVIGAVLMVLSGSLTMDEAYQSIEWRSIFLIAGMLPLGTAMETTGTAQFLADNMVGLLQPLGPLALLAGIYVLASIITEPMSNAAATVLIVPIAIDMALSVGASPQTFVLATVIAASTSFLTPVGHQANVLVLGPGGYRFFDYTRVGLPLNVLLFVVTMITLPIFWPLF